jgi:hypothetical protein
VQGKTAEGVERPRLIAAFPLCRISWVTLRRPLASHQVVVEDLAVPAVPTIYHGRGKGKR